MNISTEKKVGIFFLATLIALGVMIELVQGWSPFEKRLDYRAYFDAAVGIRPGDPVRLAGVEVGKIETIGIEGLQVRIDFYVVEGTVIRSDTVAGIRQTNLLGGQFLGLDFGSAEAPVLPPGSAVRTREATNIDQLLSNLDRNQERVLGELGDLVAEMRRPLADATIRLESVVRKIDQGEGTLGRIVNDPRLYDELQGAFANLNGVLAGMEKGEGTLGRLMKDPGLYEDLSLTMANLRDLSAKLTAGEGTLGRLFTDDSLYENASGALANFRDLTGRAVNGEGALGKLLTEEELYHEALELVSRLRSIAAKIDNGQGTLGMLVNEDDLYRDARTTLHKVERTVDGLADSGPLSALGVVLGTFF